MARRKYKLPPRGPNEEPATRRQLDYLQHLGDFSDSELEGLGKWQASTLIDTLQEEKNAERPSRRRKDSKNTGCGCLTLILILVVSIWALKTCNKSPETPPQTPEKPLPLSEPSKEDPPAPPPTAPPTKPVEKPVPLPVKEPQPTMAATPLPAEFTTVAPVKLLDAAGKETEIPEGTRLTVQSRTAGGTLTIDISGKLYVGHESRLGDHVKAKE